MKKIISLLSALLITITLIFSLGISANAKESKEPVVVVGIGDSITQGCTLYSDELSTTSCNMPNSLPYTGLEELKDARDTHQYLVGYIDNPVTPEETENNRKLVSAFEKAMLNAFPVQVAMSLNLTKEEIAAVDTFAKFKEYGIYESLSCNALRSRDIRAVLDPEYYARLEKEGFDALWYSPEVQALHRVMTYENISTKVEKADLILYSVSEGDFYYAPKHNSEARFEYKGNEVRFICSFIYEMAKGLASWMENTPVILEKLMEINPDATIVLTGAFNFYDNRNLTQLTSSFSDDMLTLLKNAITPVIGTINQAMREWADRYDNVIFVDINGVETNGEDGSGDDFHPSIKGHSFIARRILSALPESFISRSEYDLFIDLKDVCQNEAQVMNVYINGNSFTDFTQNGYTLQIHYTDNDAGIVAVTTKDSTTYWQASYNETDGYRTYSLVTLPSASKVTKAAGNLVKNAFETLLSKIKNKFAFTLK